MADFVWGLMQRGHQVQVLCANESYLGASGNGPSGEKVARCLSLKGSFQDRLEFYTDPERCRKIDITNQNKIRNWLKKVFGMACWSATSISWVEILKPLIDEDKPTLHHIGFVTPPYEPSLRPKTNKYQLVCASQAVKQTLIQRGMSISEAPVVYPGARVEMYGSHVNRRPLPALPSPLERRPLKDMFCRTSNEQQRPTNVTGGHRNLERQKYSNLLHARGRGISEKLHANHAEFH